MSSDKNTSTDKNTEMNMVIFIDREKLPEDILKMIEEHIPHIPKDIKEQLKLERLEISQDKQINYKQVDNKLFAIQTGEVVGNIYTDKDKQINNEQVDNKLFAIQTGEVVGNIYTDNRKDTSK